MAVQKGINLMGGAALLGATLLSACEPAVDYSPFFTGSLLPMVGEGSSQRPDGEIAGRLLFSAEDVSLLQWLPRSRPNAVALPTAIILFVRDDGGVVASSPATLSNAAAGWQLQYSPPSLPSPGEFNLCVLLGEGEPPEALPKTLKLPVLKGKSMVSCQDSKAKGWSLCRAAFKVKLE